jgi:anhydro-N-acetylmuramic acid kinase
MSKAITVLGIMSGSSLDGVDLAWIRFSNPGKVPLRPAIEWVATQHVPYSDKWIKRLKTASSLPASKLLELDAAYATYQADILQELQTPHLNDTDVIGWHGHTIFHNPSELYSYQLGRGDILSFHLQCPVICNFRNQDIASGGQGAPLAPIVDRAYFESYDYLINLGGIANISINNQAVSAFDICGFNQVLNYLAQQEGHEMDKDGQLSQYGQLDTDLRKQLNNWSYLGASAPKSLSNQDVRQFYFPLLNTYKLSTADKLKTFLVHVCDSIEEIVPRTEKCNILFSGGGAKNTTFMDLLKERFTASINKASPPWLDYKEAFLMAYMAYLRWQDLPNVHSSATGSAKDQSLGVVFKV